MPALRPGGAAAEISFFNVSLPQRSQLGVLDPSTSCSNVAPQASQLYSKMGIVSPML
jgi:hypothetical protein